MSSLLILTLCHSISLSLSLLLAVCLVCLSDCLFLNLTTARISKYIAYIHYSCARKSSLAVGLCNKKEKKGRKKIQSERKCSNGIGATPDDMRGWASESRKKACLIIFLITSVTIPKLFCTESAREYANRHCYFAPVCWVWAEEKSALWCFLVLNFKRKVKNVQEFSL